MPVWLRKLTGWLAVWLAALRHDVFLFSYGLSFADGILRDGMSPLRRLRRKTVFIFNGSDSRATYCDRTGYFIEGRITETSRLLALTREKADRLRRVHAMADLVIDYPLSGHFHTRKYLNFIRLGIPTVVPPEDQLPPPPGTGFPGRPVRIIHCPSDTGIKGSAEVRRVIERLKTKGWSIDYVELRGVPNTTVMAELRKCDVVIDQLFSDTPMAGFAREAAQFARPVIIAGYAWGELPPHLPADEWPPAVTCHPDRLEECVRDFLDRGPDHWRETGLRGYRFMRERWGADTCAGRLLQAIYKPESSNIWVEPGSCRYIWGCGMHALEIVETAQAIMRTAGPAGFCLDDKPELLALTAALGSIRLMDSPPTAIPALPPLDEKTWSVVSGLVERNAALSAKCHELEKLTAEADAYRRKIEELGGSTDAAAGSDARPVQESLKVLAAKLEDFRGMIERRDHRIAKLEKKLGISKDRKSSSPEKTGREE